MRLWGILLVSSACVFLFADVSSLFGGALPAHFLRSVEHRAYSVRVLRKSASCFHKWLTRASSFRHSQSKDFIGGAMTLDARSERFTADAAINGEVVED